MWHHNNKKAEIISSEVMNGVIFVHTTCSIRGKVLCAVSSHASSVGKLNDRFRRRHALYLYAIMLRCPDWILSTDFIRTIRSTSFRLALTSGTSTTRHVYRRRRPTSTVPSLSTHRWRLSVVSYYCSLVSLFLLKLEPLIHTLNFPSNAV